MTTLFDLFDSKAHFKSNRTALSMRVGLREDVWSYTRTRRTIDGTASRLMNDHGFRRGDRVMIHAPNTPASVAALYGVMRAGLIAVPMDIDAAPDFLDKVGRSTQARAVLGVRQSPDLKDVPFIPIETLTAEVEDPETTRPDASQIAEIVFTSGTTGAAKGVVLTHGNLSADVTSILPIVPKNDVLSLLSMLPLSHMFEQTVGLAMPLLLGGSVHYSASRRSQAVQRALARHKITCMVVVPQMLELMYDRLERAANDRNRWPDWDAAISFGGNLPFWLRRRLFHSAIDGLGGHLSFFMVGGAPLPPKIARGWEAIGIRVMEGYGATECAPVIASNTITDRRPGSIGRALPGVDVRLSTEGEVQVRGGNVTSGYWKDDKSSAEAFTSDGWFRTGDLAQMDASGRLTLKGRLKDMIPLSSGMNVYPEDVENVLVENPGIDEVTVVGLPDDLGNIHVHAVLCSHLSDDELAASIQQANSKLADFQHIANFTRWSFGELPRTQLLKVKRSQVRDILMKVTAPPTKPSLSFDGDPLKTLVSNISKRPQCEFTDDSDLRLDLGLDSLSMVELASSIELDLGVSVDETDLGELATFGDLVELVGDPGNARDETPLPLWPLAPAAQTARKLLQFGLIFPLVRLFARPFRTLGVEKIQVAGKPCLLVANHASHFDTLSILRALPSDLRNRLAIAAADDYFFRTSLAAKTLGLCLNAFPFSRIGNIRTSLEHCGDLVDAGWSILIYPEGTRSPDGKLLPFKPGIGLLATGLKVPVVPLAVFGGSEILPKGKSFPRPAPASVTFGEPLVFPKDCSPSEITEALETSVATLMAMQNSAKTNAEKGIST